MTGSYFELFVDRAGEYRWRLRDARGMILAVGGEGYSSATAAESGIAAVKKDAASAGLLDRTTEPSTNRARSAG